MFPVGTFTAAPQERTDSTVRLDFERTIKNFSREGSATIESSTQVSIANQVIETKVFTNEFWTARQRQANSLHEISYRACFKPQLPAFFIASLTAPGDFVYDPFMGRGTTPLEAALHGRVPLGNDINPLSAILLQPRLNPPSLDQIKDRLDAINLTEQQTIPEELLVFYHPETLAEIVALRHYLSNRVATGEFDSVDSWIRMVAINRLTGHSSGFFSVYTLPPNQAVSIKSQQKINRDRDQTPPKRSIHPIILKKSRTLFADVDSPVRATLAHAALQSRFLTGPADSSPALASNSVHLTVTSPPFLDVVDYAGDNWLRCWFAGVDAESVALTVPKKIAVWREIMTRVLRELYRVTRPGGHVAFEVGEVRSGSIKLDETVLLCGIEAGFKPLLIMINAQDFTKTANCWGVGNNSKGTNTNRIVLFRKESA